MSGLRTYLALQDRDLVPYQPGEPAANLVSLIVLEAGHDPVSIYEAHGAYVELGCNGCTVGQVAEKVIERRGLATAGVGEQVRLFD